MWASLNDKKITSQINGKIKRISLCNVLWPRLSDQEVARHISGTIERNRNGERDLISRRIHTKRSPLQIPEIELDLQHHITSQ
jgi:hypothetical protein